MTANRFRTSLVAAGMTLMLAASASAQVFGTFSWQMQPYCNIVTMTITQIPGGYTIDGNDNQCGVGGKLAGAAGMALLNPDGTVGLEFTIVTAPSGKADAACWKFDNVAASDCRLSRSSRSMR